MKCPPESIDEVTIPTNLSTAELDTLATTRQVNADTAVGDTAKFKITLYYTEDPLTPRTVVGDVAARYESGKIVFPTPVENNTDVNSITDPTLGIAYSNGTLTLVTRDAKGGDTGQIVMKVPKITGNGTAATGSVTSIEIQTKEKEFINPLPDLPAARAAIQVSAALSDLPKDEQQAALTIEQATALPTTAQTSLAAEAKTKGLELGEPAAVFQVKKGEQTTKLVKNATVTLLVSMEWVNSLGGPRFVRIVRVADNGSTEILATQWAGTTEANLSAFLAESPNGLSLFALYAVSELQVATPTPTITPTATPVPSLFEATVLPTIQPQRAAAFDYITPVLVLAAVLIVGLLAYTFLKSRAPPQEESE